MTTFDKTKLFEEKYLNRLDAIRDRLIQMNTSFYFNIVHGEDNEYYYSYLSQHGVPNYTPTILQILLNFEATRIHDESFAEIYQAMQIGTFFGVFPERCQPYPEPEGMEELTKEIDTLTNELVADDLPMAIIISRSTEGDSSFFQYIVDSRKTMASGILAATILHDYTDLNTALALLYELYTGTLETEPDNATPNLN